MDNKAAEKVGQQVLGRKSHSNTTHATKGKHARNTKAQRLQTDQHGRNDHHGSRKLTDRVNGGVIHGFFHFYRRDKNALSFLYCPEQLSLIHISEPTRRTPISY